MSDWPRSMEVRPIDRDALRKVIWELVEAVDSAGWTNATVARAETAVLALVRPVEGVVLTAEDKALVVDALREIPEMDTLMAKYRPSRQQEIDERLALAARLEAGQ